LKNGTGCIFSGIQVGDGRRFAIPNPRFKDFPVLYNPVILDQYDLIPSEGEGCLSFPGLWVQVPRYKFITVRYRDGQWQERTATFGDDNPNTEAGLSAKAIQHEIFHMDGVVTHERIKDPGKRIKVQAQILKASLEQNKKTGIPRLVDGPLELDPANLPVQPLPAESAVVDTLGGSPPGVSNPKGAVECETSPVLGGSSTTDLGTVVDTGQ
jgi:peptide deformylase